MDMTSEPKNSSTERTDSDVPIPPESVPIPLDEAGGFPDRLKEAMGSESPHAFAKRCGASYSVMLGYLKGKSEPTRPVLVRMARAADVSLAWLAAGIGPKTQEEPSRVEGIGDRELMAEILKEAALGGAYASQELYQAQKENLSDDNLKAVGWVVWLPYLDQQVFDLCQAVSDIGVMNDAERRRATGREFGMGAFRALMAQLERRRHDKR